METKQITIGGSEIAAVMGMNRWKSPLRLWAEKTEKIAREDISGKEYVQLGTELEQFVARKFERVTDKKVRRDRKTFIHPDYSFAIGHIDRRITGTDELLECKTTSMWKAREWEGEDIPQEYILQVMWYLGIASMSKGYIACLIGGQKFVWKEINFDVDLFQKMIDSAKEFISMCEEDRPPVVVGDDIDTLKRLYPSESLPLVEDETYNNMLEELTEVKKGMKEAEKRKASIESKIMERIGESKGLLTPEYKVLWKEQSRTYLDQKAIKEAGLYDKYAVSKSIRILRIYKNKERNNE